MTKDEAMKLALEALERANQTAMLFSLKARVPECGEFAGIAQDLDWAVETLRQALEQPEQEPVAWFVVVKKDGKDRYIQMSEADPEFYVPLYAAPPKQEFVCSTGLCHYKHWVGLTDEEIDYLEFAIGHDNFLDFARAIEAKLRAKNGF